VDRNRFDQLYKSLRVVQDPDEFYWLLGLVEALQPKAIIELGVEAGGSLKFWEQLLPTGGLLVGVDLHPENITWDIAASDRSVCVVQGDSQSPETVSKVGELLQGCQVDFIFIDATHTPEAARRDFGNYTPFLRPGGIVGFHDLADIMGFFGSLQGRKESVWHKIGTGVWFKP